MQETSPILDKIIRLLENAQIEYDRIIHQPVYTSQDAARIRDTNIKQGAKAIIFSADKKPILIVVPGDRKIDTKKFKKDYQKIKDLRMLTPDEVKNLTGLEVGAIPPFGNVIDLPTYLDRLILENEWIVFNAGSHTQSIKMRSHDFVKLCKPEIEDFSV